MPEAAQGRRIYVPIEYINPERRRRACHWIFIELFSLTHNFNRQEWRRLVEHDYIHIVAPEQVPAVANEVELPAETLLWRNGGWKEDGQINVAQWCDPALRLRAEQIRQHHAVPDEDFV